MLRTSFLLLLLGLALSACHGNASDEASTAAAATASATGAPCPCEAHGGNAAGEPGSQAPCAADTAAAAGEPSAEPAAAGDEAGPPETPHPYDETADARAEIDAAIAASGTDGKPVLLVFGANWCPWCRRLDYLMKHDPTVLATLDAGFHLVHVDAGERHSDTNRAIDQAYGHPIQNGLPVLVVLNAQGEVVHTQETGALEQGDHHDPAKVLEFLRRFGHEPQPT